MFLSLKMKLVCCSDFTCQLKRKMPLQGRLFLSARIIGFHSDLFGRKTKFMLLWEDIESIHVYPPTFSSMVSPIIVMTLRLGRGLDAKHGAKSHDAQGRLKFHFQSFVSFNAAYRIIKALWKAKSLIPEQKVRIAQEEDGAKDLHILEEEPVSKSLQVSEEDSDTKTHPSEENGSFFGLGDVGMSLFYYSVIPVPIKYVMELFSGNELEQKAMETSGCLNYSNSSWHSEKADVYERNVYYRSKQISQYKGEVTSTQQKSRLSDKDGWVIEEVMTFHGIPLGDYFNPDAFLCSINDVKVNNAVDPRARNVVPGVEGFLRQKLSGQGLAFIVGGGTVVQKSLEVGEVLSVDVSSIIALSGTVNVQVKYNGPMRRVVFGGENGVTAVLTGPGIVFIQSMPFHRLSQRIARAVASPNMRDNPKFFFQIAVCCGVRLIHATVLHASILEMRWSGVGLDEWWRNEQFWVIGGVSAHLFAVFQGLLKVIAGFDTNFTVTSKGGDAEEFSTL